MKKTADNSAILRLMVSVYNQTIQTYHYFPDVILCGHKRMEPEELNELINRKFVSPLRADTFGTFYQLSKEGEQFLFRSLLRRKQKVPSSSWPVLQSHLPFLESFQ